MKRLKKHQDRLAVVRKAQEALLDLADKESRDLSMEEEATYAGYDQEAADLEKSIAREKSLQEWEKRLDVAPAEPDLTPTGGDKQPKKFGNLGEQIKAVVAATRGGPVDPRLQYQAVALGHGEDTLVDGGYLVQQEFAVKLMARVYQNAQVASRCDNMPIGAAFNGTRWVHIDETSRATGSRYGGVRAYWRAEGGSVTAFTSKLGKEGLDLEDMMAVSYLTNELLQDSVALEGFLLANVPNEMAFKLDDTIISGTGSGQPLGVVGHTATRSIAKEDGQTANTINYTNIQKMWMALWAPSRANAVWFINQDCELQLNSMSLTVGTGGVPVYLPAGGLSTSPYSTLMGRPVIPIEQCPTLGTVGDIILADMSQYQLITKGGVKQDSSIHVQFLTNETTLRWVYRCNGMPKWKAKLTPFKGTNTLAPIVTLATRA